MFMVTQIHHVRIIVNIPPDFFVPILIIPKIPLEIIAFFETNPPKMAEIRQGTAEVGLEITN